MAINKQNLIPGSTVQVKLNGAPVTATYVEWSDRYNMAVVDYQGRRMPRKVLAVTAMRTAVFDEAAPDAAIPAATTMPPINVRFDYLRLLVGMVATATPTSLIVTGSGGLGKSFTVFDKLREDGLEDGEDYIVVKGYTTPKSMYRTLYDNRDRIVIFDDCDSVLTNDSAINLLKSALDSTPVRRISWITERSNSDSEDSLPSSFDFVGKVIFISNMTLGRIPQPLLSRALYVDVTMTSVEKLERIRAIAPAVRPEVTMAIKHDVIDLIDALKDRTKDLNIRTFIKILDVRQSAPLSQWRDVATYIVTTGGDN